MKRTKSSVYLETTVVSYLTARPSRDIVLAAHQQLTHEWWQRRASFDLFVSQAVICHLHTRRADRGLVMAKDPIVEETRAIREDLAKAHGYDVHEIARALRREEAKGEREVLTLTPRRISPSKADRKAG